MRVPVQHMLGHIFAHLVKDAEFFGRERFQRGQPVFNVGEAVGVRRGLSAAVVIGWGFGLRCVVAVFGFRGWRLSFLSRLFLVIIHVVS